jgi:hypothetical protein
MKWFIGNEAEKTTITFPDVSSFASNAGSDTDDNQNPGCNSPLDNDGGNEVQRPMNFEECWGHDPEIIINENRWNNYLSSRSCGRVLSFKRMRR